MPNIKSAKKRVLVNEKKNSVNKNNKSEVKTAIKKLNDVIDAGNYEEAVKLLPCNRVCNKLVGKQGRLS